MFRRKYSKVARSKILTVNIIVLYATLFTLFSNQVLETWLLTSYNVPFGSGRTRHRLETAHTPPLVCCNMSVGKRGPSRRLRYTRVNLSSCRTTFDRVPGSFTSLHLRNRRTTPPLWVRLRGTHVSCGWVGGDLDGALCHYL